ncbi:hypothetical protein XENTR_v10021794 [Xenopus tropicalis]|uniref:G protein-coupled receptor 132 n=1 Tax=Xenopus tropicalis TaxID=8364 RepID=B1H1F0_XENTR|nr:probable G-protein coupled receptor 132 [Xenopus tropicalis]XP_012823472.1 probable G-protein coupled receptor 132 isoform X1 [Xenopus tropicalis]XP_031746070.1 probable G-protein coupled receptor 132 isoform X1 [Xenopus tropicalis]XP_031746071.1 probable G-protein coupled receptor 132 isoform X1 [Xenopus tropicalis]AAI60582.1 LOC100145370 protein [Xenopus tropicalis]KAE8586903.1 hypothetical protein XENTR_v10021794 [Xenopus tropicalis]KAE8586904.1 hypothetical protein XENTR_v10021794 [Xen|eukprot:XP_012823472.1 PREDICTED: probable G-protein coupled receptor 132 isoform X1 [Xenopus tropicalis]
MGTSATHQTWILNQTGNTSTCNPEYNKSVHFVTAMYSVVLVIGFPANMLTLWLTILQIRRKNVLAVYLFSLSLSELMYLGTLPLWILYVKNDHKWQWGALACKITGYIFFNNIYISILLLCCISLDRFVAVQYSLEFRGIRRQRIAAIITLVLCFTVALIHSTAFMINEGDTEKQSTCFETLPMPQMVANFYFARFIIGFLLPLTVLMFTNCSIKRRIQTSDSFTHHQKSKVKYLSIAVITIFMICFAPYHLVLLIRAIAFVLNPDNSCPFEENIYTSNAVLLCLVTVNSVADPFIYVLVSENVRKDICRGLRTWRRQLSTSVKSDNSIYPHIQRSRELPEENSSAQPVQLL